MKTLLLAATILAATGAVAVPDAPTQTTPAIAMAPAPDEQKTLEDAVEAAQTDEARAEALMKLGVFFSNQKRYEPARAAYQKALALPFVAGELDAASSVRVFIAQSYADQEQWQNAINVWEQLVRDANSPQMKATFQLAQAQAYSELQQTDKARALLEQLRAQMAPLSADPNAGADARGFAFLIVGKSYQAQNHFDMARQSFESVRTVAEVSLDLQVNALKSLAEIADKQNRTADAQTALNNARQLMINQASAQFAARAWEDAADSYREAAQIGTLDAFTRVSLHWQLGNALREMGDIDGARAEFQAVIDTAPDASLPMFTSMLAIFKPFSYQYLAEGYIAQGKIELARAALNSEIAIPDLQAPIRQKAQELLKSLP